MHNKVDELLNDAGVGGRAGSTGSGTSFDTPVVDVIQQATDQIQQLKQVTQTNVDTIAENTEALSGSPGGFTDSITSGLGPLSQTASGLLSGGLLGGSSASGLFGDALSGGLPGIGSIISGIAGLFDSPSTPPTLTAYDPAPSQSFSEALSGGMWSDAAYSQTGQAEAVPFVEPGLAGAQSQAGAPSNQPGTDGGPSRSTAPQITIQIQALDSQSILDRSTDIANAVRQAMLNMSSLNDVVTDL